MASTHDIYSIVARLRSLEEGLNADQRRVNQLSATFKPKTVSVLTAKTDPKNPMAGKMVGGCEESIQEDDVSEDQLVRDRHTLADYLRGAEQRYHDSHLRDRKKTDSDIKPKFKQDRDLIAREGELDSALSGIVPAAQPPGEPGVSIRESATVKTVRNECGLWEMRGDDHSGFEIHMGNRRLPSRFKTLDEAEMAIEMFNARRQRNQLSQDYLDEA
jgi:hypothetical protein